MAESSLEFDLLTRVRKEITRLYPELDSVSIRELVGEKYGENKEDLCTNSLSTTTCTASGGSEDAHQYTKNNTAETIISSSETSDDEIVVLDIRDGKKRDVIPSKKTTQPQNDLLLYYRSKEPVKSGRMKTFRTPTSFSSDGECKSSDPGSRRNENEFLASLSEMWNPSAGIGRKDDAVKYLKEFQKSKATLVERLFTIYNEHIFGKKLPEDLPCIWNVRLTKTAGLCEYLWNENGQRVARIELSEKVCDNAERVRDTLIHEMCHAAAWIVNSYRGGHNKIWKYWASRSSSTFPSLPPIRRCHSFQVHAKYVYTCNGCGQQVRRHSKSLDTEKQICGICRGRFELSENTAHSSTSNPRPTPKFALFIKSNYKGLKEKKPRSTHKELMQDLAEQFKRLDFDDSSQV